MFGLTKQGYYQRIKRENRRCERNKILLAMVDEIRKKHPRAGTRKLLVYMRCELEEAKIKIGRDLLNKLLRENNLLVKKTRRFHITTDSNHFFYKSPNILKETELTHSEQVVVSDITYLKTDEEHAYLALATDPYSKKIMGYDVDNNMRVELVKKALKMAHRNMMFKHDTVIHHSDRGIQYCCPDYSELAEKLHFKLSTTQQYDPYENAVAERINETLKYEYGLNKRAPNLKILKKMVKQSIDVYNNERVHWSLGLRTPEEVHRSYNSLKYKSYSKKKVIQ
ncbi:IS3 family transposase [Fluviicola sp.]|uniref:IS3 family transposase n=1 Tax=Fluviicola sp. TaxID=1917219 RepID=UPI00283AAD2D|nr:IS3 family transposase [Fluviicola sp.]